ncbi:MAG: hypothetical protein CMK07_14530 [Ponticaulis sp.]|nr:hypothetical protein [Ponticaulis sp.]
MKHMLTGFLACALTSPVFAEPVHVGPHNFVRAETDRYMQVVIDRSALGEIAYRDEPTDLGNQTVIRMNLDTLYSSGVFDMQAGPVTVTLPTPEDGRYISAGVLDQDHLEVAVFHEGTNTFTAEDVNTRYAVIIIRTFMNARDEDDIAYANKLQDQIVVSQEDRGSFEVPEYDAASLDATRMALLRLGALSRGNLGVRMGTADEVDKLSHMIVTAVGWGLLPPDEAAYFAGQPEPGMESVPHELTLKDVPADAFWSVTMYNARGFMVENDLGVNAINNINGVANDDGSYRLQFGGCKSDTVNCIPVPEGWNYVLRAYKPGEEILSGEWQPPAPTPVR